MTRSKEDIKELNDTVKLVYRLLSYSYQGFPVRISEFWNILFRTFNIKNPEDYINYWDQDIAFFDSYIIDNYSKWVRGEKINFDSIQEKISSILDTSVTKKLTGPEDFQDRLWAIFLYLSDPNIKL